VHHGQAGAQLLGERGVFRQQLLGVDRPARLEIGQVGFEDPANNWCQFIFLEENRTDTNSPGPRGTDREVITGTAALFHPNAIFRWRASGRGSRVGFHRYDAMTLMTPMTQSR